MTDTHSTDAPAPVRLETATALDRFVADHDRALVEFYTAGCGACAAMEPVLGLVAEETGVPVALINPRDDPTLIGDYNITRVPTLVIFENGTQIDRLDDEFVGADRVVERLR
ncbi:thioredoxin family protein [Haloplanus sp.]|uniref:thioredoxin family protein n=1 Tax=Haloplanus sp. TaxID=1961696 RepID=UPI00263868A2|nr:thioredoxin family protein [Haloplanus sp.]